MLEGVRSLLRGHRTVPAEAAVPALARPATIQPFDVFADVLIKNASTTGIMGESATALAVGRQVQLSLDGETFFPGIVWWVKDGRFGLEWTGDTPPIALPASSASPDSPAPPGARRIALRLRATLAVGGAALPAIVRAMAEDGLTIEVDDHLRRGQHVLIGVGSRPFRRCRVSLYDGNTGILAYCGGVRSRPALVSAH